ncbi:unnamed protein product [Withania somnifera]
MKAGGYLLSFKGLNKKNVAGIVSSDMSSGGDRHDNPLTQPYQLPSPPSSLRWRFKNMCSGLRWKSKRFYKMRYWIVDCFLFKIVSVFEAIFLVSTLAFFYLCCGCHI